MRLVSVSEYFRGGFLIESVLRSAIWHLASEHSQQERVLFLPHNNSHFCYRLELWFVCGHLGEGHTLRISQPWLDTLFCPRGVFKRGLPPPLWFRFGPEHLLLDIRLADTLRGFDAHVAFFIPEISSNNQAQPRYVFLVEQRYTIHTIFGILPVVAPLDFKIQ